MSQYLEVHCARCSQLLHDENDECVACEQDIAEHNQRVAERRAAAVEAGEQE